LCIVGELNVMTGIQEFLLSANIECNRLNQRYLPGYLVEAAARMSGRDLYKTYSAYRSASDHLRAAQNRNSATMPLNLFCVNRRFKHQAMPFAM